MANDREVLREIWDGKLPVRFILNDEEVSDLQTPESYYLMVPRLSYFPLIWDKVSRSVFIYNYSLLYFCFKLYGIHIGA